MKEKENSEKFNIGEEDDKIKKNKSKKIQSLKYRIALILLILLCAWFLLMLFKLYRMKKLDKVFIKLLIVSDMHDDVESLDRLIKKVKSTRYNYVLYLGDFVNMIQGQQNSSQFADKYQKRIKQYLNKLEKIASVFYIPGNDDHSTMHVLNSPTFTKTSININNRYIKLRDNLYIMGLGGSVPILNGGKYDKNMIPFSTLNKSDIIQKGFPFDLPKFELDNYNESDKWYGKEIINLIKNVKIDAEDNPYQSILLTHNGPFYSWTNIQQELGTGEHLLYLGSMELEKILINDENLILNIHGHAHTSRGIVTMIPGKTVINPGALINGFYGELTLKKNENKWAINSMSLLEF